MEQIVKANTVRNASPDVLIIGAGPAGSASAIELCRLGFSVALLDKAHFPRTQVGESLPPSIVPLLEYFGVISAINKADFHRSRHVNIAWGASRSERDHPPEVQGFNVDRSVFDNLLAKTAAKHGAELLLGVKVKSWEKNPENERWYVVGHDRHKEWHFSPRFIVNATGRNGLKNSGRKRLGNSQLAVYAYWNLTSDHGLQDACIETDEDHWGWFCKLSKDKAVAAFFVDPGSMSRKGERALKERYLQSLETKTFSKLANSGCIDGEIHVCNASIIKSNIPVCNGWLDVGDACIAQNPISSQGVQAAMAMALQCAAVINTTLSYPEKAKVAESFYINKQEEKIREHIQRVSLHYLEASKCYQTPYWDYRYDISIVPTADVYPHADCSLSSTQVLVLAPNATVVNTQVIKNSLIQEQVGLWKPGLRETVTRVNVLPISELLKKISSGRRVDDLVYSLIEFGSPVQLFKGLKHLVCIGLLTVQR